MSAGIEPSIVELLEGQFELQELVGDRIYAGWGPSDESISDGPVITYRRNDGERVRSHVGRGTLERATIEISAWADTYGEVKTVIEKVVDALEAKRDKVVEGKRIQGIFVGGHADNFVQLPGSDRPVFQVLIDADVHWAPN